MSHGQDSADPLESALGKFPCVTVSHSLPPHSPTHSPTHSLTHSQLQGCPRECTAGHLLVFFSNLKPLDIVFKPFAGQLNANALVLFSCVSDALEALKKDRENMGKRYIIVKLATRMEYYEAVAGRVRLESERYSHSLTHSYAVVKMRGLPFNVTYEDIVLFFSGE
jgi:hypothetical protein